MNTTQQTTSFATLLETATTQPGSLNQAYHAFHQYSLGNQVLAMLQCRDRDLPIGPIATFVRWKELGRHVMKGQKAIELCLPVTRQRDARDGEAATTPDGKVTFQTFIYRRNWFVLAQTDGEPYHGPEPATWNRERALSVLNITDEPFTHIDGNCQGYARARSIAISPVATHPYKTTFHELAHVLLGHTSESDLADDARTPRTLRECEAESVAMLCCAALDLPGLDDARGYIQHWYGAGQPIPEASARKIFKVADAILKAGIDAGRVNPSLTGD